MDGALFAAAVVLALAALTEAAPRPLEEIVPVPVPVPVAVAVASDQAPAAAAAAAAAPIEIIMVTQSPAEAIQDAIRYAPEVAAALQSNSTNLYLRKSVTYTNGTAEDLGLPKEQLLPGGAPDRVRVADKILYSSPQTSTSEPAEDATASQAQPNLGIHATLELVPVPIN